jgi:transposase
LKADPLGGAVALSGVVVSLARSCRSSEEEVVVGVEQWAEIRRLYFVKRSRSRRSCGAPATAATRSGGRCARWSRRATGDRRGPRSWIRSATRSTGCWRSDPRLPGKRLRELLEEEGYAGGKTILDDYLREVRPLFLPRPRTFQRSSYRPGALCQFDLWEPSREIPVAAGQTRRGYVVIGCLPYSRAGAGTLVFSKEAPDLLYGVGECLRKLEGLPETLVWDREGALHAGGGHPTEPFAAFCGQLGGGWRLLEAKDPQSKGVVERLQGYAETSFQPGRSFAGELDFQQQLDRWFEDRANLRFHRTLRCRPSDRLAEELTMMRPLPERMPDVDRRFVRRVPPDPYVRVDTSDYSLDPRLLGRRVEVRVSQREVVAVALDTGELACRHVRSFTSPHDHGSRARTSAARAPRRSGRAGGRDAAARPLRPADPSMTKQAELAYLFRTLKAPAAARALPKLAERARAEEWSYERFAEALLATEVASRDAHGGEARIKQARFPARKTLEEFDFSFQRSVQKTLVLHLGQLDFLTAKDNVVLLGPPGTGKTHLAIALGIRACLAGQRVCFATATEWVARLGGAQRQGRLDEELRNSGRRF